MLVTSFITHSDVHYYNHEEKYASAHERNLSCSSVSLAPALHLFHAGRRTRTLRGNVALQSRLTWLHCQLTLPSLVKIKLRFDLKAKSLLAPSIENVEKSGLHEAYATVSRTKCGWKLTIRISFVLAFLPWTLVLGDGNVVRFVV